MFLFVLYEGIQRKNSVKGNFEYGSNEVVKTIYLRFHLKKLLKTLPMLCVRSAKKFFKSCSGFESARYLSNKTAYFTTVHRKFYLRLYPTLLVQPDGSTYYFRYHEPRRIVKLPLDMSTLSAEEKQKILEKRKLKKKTIEYEDLEDEFSSRKYVTLIKKSTG